ncbi:MAG: septum formation inhibitor Maf [Clostridiales bacterium]|nr:septum formation inhibitor Maf [Clostridiales bacterium]
MKLVLASASPRRCEILKNAGYKFDVCPAQIDETIGKTSPSEAVCTLSKNKAKAVFESLENKENVAVLGSDTIVVLDGKILGKPKNEAEAVSMLTCLSGKKHKVYTGVCVVTKSQTRSFFDCTTVEFYSLSDTLIKAYVKTGEPMDKAGAYGIQGKGSMLVKSINGDFFSVMGLPIAKTAKALKEVGVKGLIY